MNPKGFIYQIRHSEWFIESPTVQILIVRFKFYVNMFLFAMYLYLEDIFSLLS